MREIILLLAGLGCYMVDGECGAVGISRFPYAQTSLLIIFFFFPLSLPSSLKRRRSNLGQDHRLLKQCGGCRIHIAGWYVVDLSMRNREIYDKVSLTLLTSHEFVGTDLNGLYGKSGDGLGGTGIYARRTNAGTYIM